MGDVIRTGMGLFASKDGITWKLLRRIWPFGGMYSTLIPLTVDKNGGALTYAVIYTAGAIGGTGVEVINFQNFTFSPSDLEMRNRHSSCECCSTQGSTTISMECSMLRCCV